MKATVLGSILLPLVAGIAVPSPGKVDYEGYKVFRIYTEHQLAHVQDKLSSLPFDQWNHDVARHIDISVSPEQLAAFEALGLDFHIMHDNLGRSLAEESAVKSKYKRDVDDMAWFDQYHPYADHIQWFNDLQAKLPENSEIISYGTSYEGRDMFGKQCSFDTRRGAADSSKASTCMVQMVLESLRCFTMERSTRENGSRLWFVLFAKLLPRLNLQTTGHRVYLPSARHRLRSQ